MPKFHDTCQIFVEETLSSLKAFPEERRAEALARIIHFIEEDLLTRRGDAMVISQHLWVVLAEFMEGRGRGWQFTASSTTEQTGAAKEAIRDDDYTLGVATNAALWLSRRLFPADGFGMTTKKPKY